MVKWLLEPNIIPKVMSWKNTTRVSQRKSDQDTEAGIAASAVAGGSSRPAPSLTRAGLGSCSGSSAGTDSSQVFLGWFFLVCRRTALADHLQWGGKI